MYMKFNELIHGDTITAPIVFDLDGVMGYRPTENGTQVLLGGQGYTVQLDISFDRFNEIIIDYNSPVDDDDDFDDPLEADEAWRNN